MLTIFTVPRPFRNRFNIIQRNAILSWNKFLPKCEIILFGNEEGTAKIAAELGLKHVPNIKCNEFGTPLVNDVFAKAQEIATYSKMAYLNTDIILMNDFIKAVREIKKEHFLMVGRRKDLDLKEEIQFNEKDWEGKLRSQLAEKGKLHGFSGIDYFIFSRGLWQDIPSFALARTSWDNWLLYRARSSGTSLIDATEVITAIHQNHDYSHHLKGETGVWKGPEAKTNLKLTGGYSHLFTIRDADWVLTAEGLKRPSFPRRIFPILSLFYPWRLTLSIKRKLQNFKIL